MKFNTMWEVFNINKPLDVPKLPKYLYDNVTYRPGAKDENGKLINDTRFDFVIKGSKTPVQEYIQSFEDDTDVYKILERCARSGDYSILTGERPYGDCSIYSSDRAVNDELLSKLDNFNSQAPKEVAEALLSNLSNEEILSIIQNLNSNKNNVPSNGASEEVLVNG